MVTVQQQDSTPRDYIAAVYVRSDKFFDHYDRKAADILTIFGDVGGLGLFLMLIGYLLVAPLARKLVMSKVIRRVFQSRNYKVIEDVADRLRVAAIHNFFD